MTVNDLEAWKLYYGIYERMNAKVDNILNNIKNVGPKDFYKKLVVLYTKIDLYKGFNEKIKELYENVNYIANQKEPNPAALFKNGANMKKFKEIIFLRKVIISKYLAILEINECELKANLTEENMEEESNSWSTTIFSTSTDAQSSDSGSSSDFGESSLTLTSSHPHTSGSTSTSYPTKESLKPLTEKLNNLKKNTINYLPNVLLAYEKLYEHYGLAYEKHEKKQYPKNLDKEEQREVIKEINYFANLVKKLPQFVEEKFDSFMLDWFQKFY
uniref:Uncharacterized protein n=1 Tax=Meloidogyne enterolobii TaxID=390850 RepID=A0A6V7XSE1_MELEN|nr:unnamed protein product [Meloidogyne enterolobii]